MARTLSSNLTLKPGDILTQLIRRGHLSIGRIVDRRRVRLLRLIPNYKAVVIPCNEHGEPLAGVRSRTIPQRNLAPAPAPAGGISQEGSL
jgi:hypothetical protein